MDTSCKKDATIVNCLLNFWLKAWNECGEPDAAYSFDAIFAKGEGAVDAVVDAFGVTIRAQSFDDYKRQWKKVFEELDEVVLSITGEPHVAVSQDQAEIKFDLVADATRADGTAITPRPRWRGEHSWRRIDGEWRIVRERLIAV